jgi:hypothetical protein
MNFLRRLFKKKTKPDFSFYEEICDEYYFAIPGSREEQELLLLLMRLHQHF